MIPEGTLVRGCQKIPLRLLEETLELKICNTVTVGFNKISVPSANDCQLSGIRLNWSKLGQNLAQNS